MAANPMVVTSTVTIPWDNASHRLVKGTVLDVPPGSALEAAIGLGNLTPLFRENSTALPAAEPEPEAEPGQDAAPKKAPARKITTDDSKDGGS